MKGVYNQWNAHSFLSLLHLLQQAPLAVKNLLTIPGNADVSATAGETVESAEPVPQLPKKDYDGYVFRIYSADYMLSEGMNGAVLNDAIYQANEEVSSQFNISFENIQGGGMDSTVITQSIASQDNAFDLINFHDCTTASLALEGVFLDVNEMPYVDSSASWWPKHIVESLSHNGKMYYFSNNSSKYYIHKALNTI